MPLNVALKYIYLLAEVNCCNLLHQTFDVQTSLFICVRQWVIFMDFKFQLLL